MCTDICPCSTLNTTLFKDYTFKTKNFTGTYYNLNTCLKETDYSFKWDYDVLWYLKQLEDTYQCTGLCRAQTMHLFTNYTSGPNFEPCYTYIADELERDLGKMGYVFLSCGSFVFCAWFCQFGLCFRDKQAKEMQEHMKAKKYLMTQIQRGEIGVTYNTRDEL